MEMHKYCWLQVIVSFLYYSFSLVATHKIFHGLIWAKTNTRKQIFSKHNLPPHLCVHLLPSITFVSSMKEFCLPGSKVFEKSHTNSKYVFNDRSMAWLCREHPYIKYLHGSVFYLIWTQEKQDSRQRRAVSQTSLVQVIRGHCLNSHLEGKLRNGPHF